MRRIDRLWSSADFNPRYDELYRKAYDTFMRYTKNMQDHLAKYDAYCRNAGPQLYWNAVWEIRRTKKVPRKVYAGY